tara:strand:- start:862 stop:1296 length:435 start_codon:yes stop_codon:yes gene_type:complete
MATTTATITLSSNDIADSSFSVSNTAILTNVGTDTGVTKTTGLSRLELSAETKIVLFGAGGSTDSTPGTGTGLRINKGKFYIKNLNARGDGSKFVTLLMDEFEIGRLYGGDWAFYPWDGGSGSDLEVKPSSTTDTTLEYIMFYE